MKVVRLVSRWLLQIISSMKRAAVLTPAVLMTTSRFLLSAVLVLTAALLASCDTLEPPKEPEVVPVDQMPAWSPDGRSIAYLHDARWSEDTTDVTGLYVLDLETEATRLVVEGLAMCPDWHPDGERIVFSGGDLFTIRADGSNLRQVTIHGHAFFPSWSPTGKRIAYDATSITEKGIWLVSPNGNARKHLGLGRDPDWSSHNRLLYEGPPGTSESSPQLWTADTSATDSTQLTDNNFINNRAPAWSPDGKWIAWTPLAENGRYQLWVMRADGTEQRKLVDRAREPAWSPDAERLVFAHPAPESRLTALWSIRRDGSDLQQLTDPSRHPTN